MIASNRKFIPEGATDVIDYHSDEDALQPDDKTSSSVLLNPT
jgi:hypothetical protein